MTGWGIGASTIRLKLSNLSLIGRADGTIFSTEGFDLVKIGGVFVAVQGWWARGTKLRAIRHGKGFDG